MTTPTNQRRDLIVSARRRPVRLTTAQAELYAACLGLATGGRTPLDVLTGYASGPYAQRPADLLAVRAALDLTARCPSGQDCPYPDCQVADPPAGCPAVGDGDPCRHRATAHPEQPQEGQRQ